MSGEIRLELSSSFDEPGNDTLILGRVWFGGVEGELVYAGRIAHIHGPDGTVVLPKEAYNAALAEQVDEIAGKIWGDDWARALAELAGINRRTTARDRVRKFGLPPDLVWALVRLSNRRHARELAGVARAMVRYLEVQDDPTPIVGEMSYAIDDMLGVIADFRGEKHRWVIDPRETRFDPDEG